jgi:hypothetical protein
LHFPALYDFFIVVVCWQVMTLVAVSRANLFAIIEGLHHASRIWTCFGQQEVVLKNSTSNSSNAVDFLVILILLQILHEARLGLIHGIGLRWIIKSARCCVLLLLTILLLFHQDH